MQSMRAAFHVPEAHPARALGVPSVRRMVPRIAARLRLERIRAFIRLVIAVSLDSLLGGFRTELTSTTYHLPLTYYKDIPYSISPQNPAVIESLVT